MFNDNPTAYKDYSTLVNRLVVHEKTDIPDILSMKCGTVTREMIQVPILSKSMGWFKNLYEWNERQNNTESEMCSILCPVILHSQ